MLKVKCALVFAILCVALAASEPALKVLEYDEDSGEYYDSSSYDHAGPLPEPSSRVKRAASSSSGTYSETTEVSGSSIHECYQYTWPGPSENKTMPDGGCARIKKYTPCFTPFVFTNDSSVPDPKVVYNYCQSMKCKVTCPKTTVNTCVRYAFYVDGFAKNITYFCGAVFDTTNNVPMKTGNIQDNINGEVRNVWFCQDDLCNSSRTIHHGLTSSSFFLTTILSFIIVLLL